MIGRDFLKGALSATAIAITPISVLALSNKPKQLITVDGEFSWVDKNIKEVVTQDNNFNYYSYYATFAIAFAKDEMLNITRMWANGELIYDGEDPLIYDNNGIMFMDLPLADFGNRIPNIKIEYSS